MTEIEQNMSESKIMGGRDIIVQDGGENKRNNRKRKDEIEVTNK